MESTTETYRVYYHDDYRSGPRIRLLEIQPDDPENDDDDNEGEIELRLGQTYDVYYLIIGIGESKAHFCKSFRSWEEAEMYAKCQYYHLTGNFPFIATGMTLGYKSEGNRIPFPIVWDFEISKISDEKSDDDYDALIIASKDYLTCHSCNPFAEW